MFTKVVVGYDGSDGANTALQRGIELAQCAHLPLYAVMVEEELPRYAGTIDEFRAVKEQKDAFFAQLGREITGQAADQGVTLTADVMPGHEIGALVDYMRKGGFDLLIVGGHGHSRLHDRIVGSTANGLVTSVPCSILVVK